MQVAIYARVSTLNQQQEGTIASQIQLLKQHVQQQGWLLLPEHEYIDDGFSGGRLDRPALDRLRDGAQRGEFDAVVILSPDRLAREYAHQWFLVEEFKKLNTQLVFLQNPFGDTPQGKLLTQMQGMIAEYERAQIVERTRRGRLEKARRGELLPWAYTCYGYRYLPKQPGAAPQVMIEPEQAEVVRGIYRALVEEQLSCRQITKRLNQSKTPTPSGKNQVWQPSVVRNILTNRVYAGQARYNYREPVIPKYRKTEESQLHYLKTGRSYRPEREWILTAAPAIITPELFDKAQLQLQRNTEAAGKMYRATSQRYLLRTLVKCGECGLGMVGLRVPSDDRQREYLYYECPGHRPLNCGRTSKCASRLVRADRLDELVWQALANLLRQPSLIPQLHQNWAAAKEQNLSSLAAQQGQLTERRARLERQAQRLLDAFQAEIINLAELEARRQKLAAERQQIEQELRRLADARQQTIHWQEVIENAETFRTILGGHLEQLSFEERQAVAQCLIKKIVVTGEEVDLHFVLPFESAPQAANRLTKEPEGAPGNFYRLRLADRSSPAYSGLSLSRIGFTLCRMQLPPFTTLNWAYQLHYYVCFRTHRRRACFAEERNVETLTAALAEICQRHEYHLLESQVYPDHVRCLLSLRPEQIISTAIQTIKASASRECNRQLGLAAPLWARGYLARGVGRVPLSIVKQYLDQQSEHHGYDKRVRPPIYRYRAAEPVSLSVAHAAFELNHHLVFATRYRRGVFGSELGETLGKYWLNVAEKRGFAIDRMTIVPDHAHLLVRITPKISIAECALALLNNGQYYIGKYQPLALIEAGVDQLWQASAYAGTRGAYTTALIKHWLSERE